jgi:hypothetical protein
MGSRVRRFIVRPQVGFHLHNPSRQELRTVLVFKRRDGRPGIYPRHYANNIRAGFSPGWLDPMDKNLPQQPWSHQFRRPLKESPQHQSA